MKLIILLFTMTIHNALSQVSFLTYNTGLAHGFVQHAEKRRDLIPRKIQEIDADVICLQEVWDAGDRKQLIDALSPNYKFSYYQTALQKKSSSIPACGFRDLVGKDKLLTCLKSNCLQNNDLSICLMDKCQAGLNYLKDNSKECLEALFAQVGNPPFKTIVNLWNPFMAAPLYAYNGESGLILMSKTPLISPNSIELGGTINRRGAIEADIESNGQRIKVVCTHLTANFEKTLPYVGIDESWEEENFRQAKKLVDMAATRPYAVLMGDFNCSRAQGEISNENARTCKLIESSKFKNYFQGSKGLCSFCSTNALVRDKSSTLLDHIYTKGLQVRTSSRVLDKNIEGRNYPPSDHYGILITAELPVTFP